MSREITVHAGTDAESADDRWSRWSVSADGVSTAFPTAALVAVAAWTGFRALHNAPLDLPLAVLAAAPGIALAAGMVPGGVAVALGLLSTRPAVRVGLLFVGVFGALGTVVEAVAIPAAVALVGGGALVLLDEDRSDGGGWGGTLRRAVPVLLVGSVALSLGAATGLLPPGTRSLGSTLVLVGLAASPTLVRPGPGGWALGALAGVGVLWAGSSLPFVTGAVTLVAFGLVGTPLLVFAAGVGGCVATVVGSLRRETSGADQRRHGAGAALVLLAGGPATVGGATAVLLGAALLAGIPATGGDRR